MTNNQDIRWIQRYKNFTKSFLFLEKALNLNRPNEFEQAGIVQAYEFVFELSWKVLKDYLNQKSVPCQYPRDVIKEAFKNELIDNGEDWIDMLEKRNLMSHTYDDENAQLSQSLIRNKYFSQFKKFKQTFDKIELEQS